MFPLSSTWPNTSRGRCRCGSSCAAPRQLQSALCVGEHAHRAALCAARQGRCFWRGGQSQYRGVSDHRFGPLGLPSPRPARWSLTPRVDAQGSPGAADRAGRSLDGCEVASETDAARDEDSGRHRRGEEAAVPVLRADEVRHLRRRIHHVGQEPARMLRRPRPGSLRQPPDHQARRGRSARADARCRTSCSARICSRSSATSSRAR